MEFLLIALIYFFEVYTLLFVVYISTLIVKKKRFSYLLLGVNLVVITIFFFLKEGIENHKLIFTGQWVDGSEDWGAGLSNVLTYATNMAILMGLFILTQIVIVNLLVRSVKRRNAETILEEEFLKK